MADWDDLERELDAWRAADRAAALWWRDDDAAERTDALRRLFALSVERQVPLMLAVVPLWVKPSLLESLAPATSVTPVQHGFAHKNWAPEGERKAEFVPGRADPVVRSEIASGWDRIRRLPRCTPVFVPPWNRGLDVVRPILQALGFRGVSAYGPHHADGGSPKQVNTHLDIIDWRGSRGFIGEGQALGLLVRHLGERRVGKQGDIQPVGVLTHHLDHDEECWDFLEQLFERTRRAGARWLDAREVFAA